MATGSDLVKLGNRHLGETYKLGAFAPKDNARWKGPWDCAEFASWLVFQTTGLLVGCTDNAANPARADAYSGAWARDAQASRRPVSLGQARATAGAVLVRKPAPGGIGHVAISRGDGSTVEAHSERRGVTTDKVDGRRWDLAMRVPLIDYPDELPVAVFRPPAALILRLRFPPMQGALIRKMQQALRVRGFDPGDVDGVFGPHTDAAVRSFQLQAGLVPDGEAGPRTLGKLGL
ncbi:peptidoglycan-binding protein [uncultured Methylibium sp.]|uniref:C40 family peptidase n=1 Tax=uncultured Methylibium sp. TaxID=381093 RepID=UPI0025D6FD4E|nr:peptidoglycan-binding protein [uncultured Methylibium sp.]